MDSKNDQLMAFQEFLLETLYTCMDVQEIKQRLISYPENYDLLLWLKHLDPEMVEVAARMVQHWGIKKEDTY
ncbi:hypothetical protein EP47_08295 [Legionella norrlandica]|uniref:Uncharacterized protein n=1 Tax=Legionella norrlandica TaxID=1498499 RepID=A0A0A2SMT3_9GAMM|nr:hypothetical protein [Legionella norrlandica]KGP62405.1 hypothetical protein EP47_08295 [Legionella norrlandica]